MFILNNVVMIYISADSLEDAFRLFSVMNDRGQKLSNADILKSSNLEKNRGWQRNERVCARMGKHAGGFG